MRNRRIDEDEQWKVQKIAELENSGNLEHRRYNNKIYKNADISIFVLYRTKSNNFTDKDKTK